MHINGCNTWVCVLKGERKCHVLEYNFIQSVCLVLPKISYHCGQYRIHFNTVVIYVQMKANLLYLYAFIAQDT